MVLSLWAGTVGRGPPLIPARSLARAHGPESLNHQGRGTQWSVGHGGGLVRWGWRALAVQGLGDLRLPDPDKDRHCAVGRRPHRPEPERLTCPIEVLRSRQRMLPCTDLPAQSVADLFRHCLRLQPERLPPGCPEHFRRGSPRRRCGGIAARYNQAEGLPRSGSGGSELARLRDS